MAQNKPLNLTDYEKEVEAGLSDKVATSSGADLGKFTAAAERTIREGKDERVNLRISASDLSALREKADEMGMPYQTLLASVVHRYLRGSLVDRQVINEVKDGPRKVIFTQEEFVAFMRDIPHVAKVVIPRARPEKKQPKKQVTAHRGHRITVRSKRAHD